MAEPVQRIFGKGIFFNDKHPSAPDFVIGSISISAATIAELAAQVEEYKNDKGYARFQITRSRDGKPCVSVDTFGLKPKEDVISTDDFDKSFSEAKRRSDEAKSRSNNISIEECPF